MNDVALNKRSSEMLDLFRALASQAVLIGHGLNYFGFTSSKVPTMQSQAVSILFLLSGFLTLYSFFNHKQKDTPYSIKSYLLNRFFRIYPVLLGGLLFIFGLDMLSISILKDGYPYMNAFNLKTIIANLLMIQDFPYVNLIPSGGGCLIARPLLLLVHYGLCP